MQYVFYGLISAFILFGILIFMRKLHWDAVHHNLFDLADEMDGQVIRRGFASRPVFHARYRDKDIAVNFSTDRENGKRRHAVDISIGIETNLSLTISSKNWLRSQKTPIAEDYENLGEDKLSGYSIRYGENKQTLNAESMQVLGEEIKKLIPFNFLFIGSSGILFENTFDNVAMGTRHPGLKDRIDTLLDLNESLQYEHK